MLASSVPAQAALILDATITGPSPHFHYEYSVENTGPEEIVIVSIVGVPLGDPDIGPSLTAPAGFLASYDSGLGIVDFLADAGLFAAGTTVSGFSFDSFAPPGAVTFTALGSLGETFAGATEGPVGAAIPEPVSGLLLGLGLGLLARRTGRPGD